MSIISFTAKKIRKKKIEFVRYYVESGTGSTITGSGSADPDLDQNEVDPKHCYKFFEIIVGAFINFIDVLKN